MTVFRTIAAVAFAGCIVAACGGATRKEESAPSHDGGTRAHDAGTVAPDASKTDTGWSEVCLSDADCKNGLICFCGLCSGSCKAPAECTRFSDKATCPGGIQATSACLDNDINRRACAIVCQSDADCSSLGPTAICSAGLCKKPALVTRRDGGIVTCDDRTAAMSPAIQDVFMRADRSCKSTGDCTTAPFGNACYGNGCAYVPISRGAEASVMADLSALGSRDCHDFFEAGCVGPGLTGCPAGFSPTCIDGTCQLPIVTATGENDSPTCDDRSQSIQDDLGVYANSIDLSCTRDADCLYVDLVSCAGGCGTLISRSGLNAITTGLLNVEEVRCVPFTAAGCRATQPKCAAATPRCIANICKLI